MAVVAAIQRTRIEIVALRVCFAAAFARIAYAFAIAASIVYRARVAVVTSAVVRFLVASSNSTSDTRCAFGNALVIRAEIVVVAIIGERVTRFAIGQGNVLTRSVVAGVRRAPVAIEAVRVDRAAVGDGNM